MWRKGENLGHPHDIAQALLQDWGALWTQAQHAKGIEVWAAIKRHAKTLITNLDPITREDLEKGLKMLNTNAAVGIDQWSPAQLRLLEDTGKDLLIDILNDIENSKACPGYAYYNIIVLMGSPNDGVRPIALIAIIYRLWTEIRRPHVVEWENLMQGPGMLR